MEAYTALALSNSAFMRRRLARLKRLVFFSSFPAGIVQAVPQNSQVQTGLPASKARSPLHILH